MKKAVCLFLVFLVVFNTTGYYGVLLLMEKQVSFKLTERIDQNAAEMGGDLLLTFPMELRSCADSDNYERADGEIVYEHVVYQMVKKKIFHNTLYLICVKDNKTTRIREVMDEFTKTFTNQQPDNSDASVKIVVSLAKYFIITGHSTVGEAEGWNREIAFSFVAVSYKPVGTSSVFRPPLAEANS